MNIEYITHACLKYTKDNFSLISDPWLLDEPVYSYTEWKWPPLNKNIESIIDDVTHIYLSHSHEDHFHIPSLNLFDRNIQIIIPEFENIISQRKFLMRKILKDLGFNNIVLLKSFQTYEISDIKITLVPSAKLRDHDWENSGLIVSSDNLKTINMNDNIADEELLSNINNLFSYFDYGFIQVSGVSNFPACFRFKDPNLKRKILKNKVEDFKQQRMLKQILNLKNIIPIAGDFVWYNQNQLEFNETARSTPLKLKQWFENEFPGSVCFLMQPGDKLFKNKFEENSDRINWNNFPNVIIDHRNTVLQKISKYDSWLSESRGNYSDEKGFDYLNRRKKHFETLTTDINVSMLFKVVEIDLLFSLICSDGKIKLDYEEIDLNLKYDQILHIEFKHWSAAVDKKIMFNMFSWIVEVEQLVEYKTDFPRIWQLLEYEWDMGSKHSQCFYNSLDALYPESMDVSFGVF